MFTVCPKCALTLFVTAGDLRVAQGYVRCGRCSNVFNALARLSEDRQTAAPPAAAQPQAGSKGTPTSKPPEKAAESRTSQTSKQRKPDAGATSKLRQPPDPSAT